MRALFYCVILTVLTNNLFSQNIKLDWGNYKLDLPKGQVQFKIDSNKIVLKYASSNKKIKDQSHTIIKKMTRNDITSHYIGKDLEVITLTSTLSQENFDKIAVDLKNQQLIESANPRMVCGSIEIDLTRNMYVKIKDLKDTFLLQKFATKLHFVFIKTQLSNTYKCTLSQSSNLNTLEISRYLQLLNLFAFVEPELIYTSALDISTNDPYFKDQWAIKNTGQYNGNSGSDMKIDYAWNITKGSPSIRIAVFDYWGSDEQFTHEDISIPPAYRFDFTEQGFAYKKSNVESHGIACAGIIGAIPDNNLGITGIAPYCKIQAVKIGWVDDAGQKHSDNAYFLNALEWAKNSTDVVSASISVSNGFLSSWLIDNALEDCVTKGRRGKGLPFFASAGNQNKSEIAYPAENPFVISVGATSPCDTRKRSSSVSSELYDGVVRDLTGVSCDGEGGWGSNYGQALDVTAPGVKIVTLDIAGEAGANNVDYQTFGGTSAACPFAAGTMALILSANPNLSIDQARYILESTCDKVGGYEYALNTNHTNGTWNMEMGYGRINAYKAVLKAASPDLDIISQRAPSNAEAGDIITIDFAEENDGYVIASPNYISFHLSADDVLTPGENGDIYIDEFYLDRYLEPLSQTVLLSKQVKIPSNVQPGTYHLFFSADGGRTVPEFDEQNNYSSSIITIGSSPPQNHQSLYRYWFDNNFTAVTTQLSSEENIVLNLNTNNLSPGHHIFNFQAKDNNDIWSSVVSTSFFRVDIVNKTSEYRYWLGNSFDSRMTVISSGNTANILLDLTDVFEGIHILNFQVKDSRGTWSSVISNYFFRVGFSNSISNYRYWYDDKFNGAQNVISGDTSITMNLDVTDLSFGNHQFHFQTQDEHGIWSSVITNYFFRVNPSVQNKNYRYWFDDKFNEATTINSSDTLINLSPDVNTLSLGYHQLNFQSQDSKDTWSSIITNQFIKVNSANSNNTYRYWFDDDFDNVLSVVSSDELIDISAAVSSLVNGIHQLHFQSKDEKGTWSPIITTSFDKTAACTLLPTVTASGNTTFCSGNSVTLTANAGMKNYLWNNGATTQSITVSTAGNYSVKITDNIGCVANSQVTSVTVLSKPSQPGAITGSNPVCENTSQSYSIASVIGADNYTWTFPNGWTGSSTMNTIQLTTGTNSGSVTVKANNTCGSSIERTLPITVNNKPAKPGAITGNLSICPSSNGTYSIQPVTGAGNYTWTLPNGWTGTSNTTSIQVTSGNSGGDISVKANNGCGSSIDQTLSVAVNSSPSQPGSISGNASVCASSNQTYSVPQVSGATSYTWTYPTGWATNNSTTNSITFTSVGTTSGQLKVKANNTCGSSTESILNITINTAPQQPGSITGNANQCVGTTTSYSVPSASDATSYAWTLPNGWSGTSNTNTIQVTIGNANGNISVVAVNGCGNSTSQSYTVTVIPLQPAPGVITGNSTVCVGTNQTYSVNTVAGASSYNWILPSGWTGNSTSNSIQAVAGGTGTITVNAINGCGDGSNSTLNVTVNRAPDQPATMTGSSQVNVGQSTTYLINAVAGASKYNWMLSGGGTITNTPVTSADVTWNTAGDFTISVNAENNCGISGNQSLPIKVMNPTAIVNPDDEFHISVMPNPTHDGFYVTAKSVAGKSLQIRIFDDVGQTLINIDYPAGANEFRNRIDLSKFANGIYIVQVIVKNKVYQRYILKL